MINACAQTGYVERAEMWLGRMLEAGVQANEVREGGGKGSVNLIFHGFLAFSFIF